MLSKRLSILLSVCVPAFALAQNPGESPVSPLAGQALVEIDDLPVTWQDRVRLLREMYAARTNQPPPQGTQPALQCHVVYKMEVIIQGDPHLDVMNPANGQPDRIRLHGPQPVTGTWIVQPVNGSAGPWVHPWTNTPYTAFPIPVSSPQTDPMGRFNLFGLASVKVAPHDNEAEKAHDYEMRFTTWHADGCPDKIEFVAFKHEDEPAYDDPGHGGAGR